MSGTEKISQETEVNTTELATVLGVTARRVQQMAQDGTLQPVRKGRFALAEAVQAYIKFLSPAMDKEDLKIEKARRAAEMQQKVAKAAVAKMEAEELRNNMHRSEDVQAVTNDLVYEIRGALAALPGRLAMDVAAVSSPAEASDIIRKEVNKVMLELTSYEYDPKKYEDRVRQRLAWTEREDDDD